MKIYTILLNLMIMLILTGTAMYGYPNGVSGYTLKGTKPGCTCHTSSPNTAVKAVISGPSTLKTGETGNYTMVLTYSSLSGAGVDIAASTGTLSSTDTRLKVLSGELTNSSKNSGSGSITWNFKYTAPSAAGPQTLYATACGVKNAWNHAPNFTVNVTSVSALEPGGSESKNLTYNLEQNYPNPFNPATTIAFTLKEQSDVVLTIYNSIGSQIEVLTKGRMEAGMHSVQWNAGNLPSGTYFYELRANNYQATRKLVLLK